MTEILIFTPKTVPQQRATRGEMYVRLDKNTLTLSAALVSDMVVNVNDKVAIVWADPCFFIVKATDDGFRLRATAGTIQFSNSYLCCQILDKNSVLSLIEDGKFPSIKFNVTKQTLTPLFLGEMGIETAWKIERPKKFENTK